MWGDRKAHAVLLNHLSAAKGAELSAPQLSGCIPVQSTWGSPKAAVSQWCRVAPSFFSAFCHHWLLSYHCPRPSRSVAGGEDCSRNRAEERARKQNIEGNASRASHTAAPAGLCLDSLAEMLT